MVARLFWWAGWGVEDQGKAQHTASENHAVRVISVSFYGKHDGDGKNERENPRMNMACNSPKDDLPACASSLGTKASGLTAGILIRLMEA